MPLILNQFFTFVVKSIQHAADSFQKKGSGVSYCHYLVLADETGEEYPSQICNDYTTLNHCKEGDMVRVKMKTFSRNRYTIESIDVTGHAPVTHTPPPTTATASSPKPNVTPDSNPNVAGKATSIALNASVAFFANRPNSNEKAPQVEILALAEHFFNFLTGK